MPPEFKSEEDVYNDLKTGLQSELPQVTNYTPGSVARALIAVIAAAIRVLYVTLETLYFNMFPQDADLESLKRYYDEWGLTWDEPEAETARRTVLNKYRENSVIGTKGWYEDTVRAQFTGMVTAAELLPNYRGPGTADLVVWHNNRALYDSDIETIQGYFDSEANKVIGIDLLVRSGTGESNAGQV